MNTPSPFRLAVWCHLALLACLPGAGLSADHAVDSIAALQSKIHGAIAGDTITLRNGLYNTIGPITVRRGGAPGEPITIRAETVGGVEIAGTHGFNITAPAAHIVISGFTFTHAAGRNTIAAGTTHVRFTRNTFQCTGDGAYLTVVGDDAQIDYNEFREKKNPGSMIAVAGTGSQIARRLWIHHNLFRDLAGTGSPSSEMIRFGLTAVSLSTGAGIVEHNLFARCRGEGEMISSRASGITYRFNTFVDSPSTQFTLRHGNDCLVYGNYFRNTEGLRIFGDRHQIFSNYFEGNYIGINLGNGSAEVAEGAPVTSHDRPDECLIIFNTLVDNRTHYQMSRRVPDPLGATKTTFAHNLLQGGMAAAKIEGPYSDGIWTGNVLWKVADPVDFPAEGFTVRDPLLSAGSDGINRISDDSPVIKAAVGASFPMVTVDIDGQPRPEAMSVGADEPSSEPSTARVLTPEDVGPQAAVFNAAPAEPASPGASEVKN